MKTATRFLCAGVWLILGVARAQDGPRGHWTGTLDVPGQAMSFEFDIDHTSKGWIGTAAIPSMNASGIPLSDIALTDGKWTFHIKAGTGDPSFSGTLSADGQTLTGTFGQGGITFPFTLKRTGDPRADLAKTQYSSLKNSDFPGDFEMMSS
jgi:hypothetical protein